MRAFGAFDTDRVEHELLAIFSSVNAPAVFLPLIGWRAIGDQKDPGAVILDAVRLVAICTIAQQV